MQKREVKEIICSSTPYGEMYTDNSLFGSIIIDGEKFEGILRNYCAKPYFVFGKINDSKIKLFLSSINDFELVKMYEIEKEGSLYIGHKYVVSKGFKMASEECMLKLLDRELTLDEIVELEQEIVDRRSSLEENSNYFYKKIMKKSYVNNKVRKK